MRMGWEWGGRRGTRGPRRRPRLPARPLAPFNILIVLLTQWNEISWRNARAITQDHSSVRHAVHPHPPFYGLSACHDRPSAAGGRERSSRRSIYVLCNARTVPPLSNRPPASGEPLYERAREVTDAERRIHEEEAVEPHEAPTGRGTNGGERAVPTSRMGRHGFHSKTWSESHKVTDTSFLQFNKPGEIKSNQN